MLQRAYYYLLQFKEYFLFAILVSISIVLMISNDNVQIRYIRSLTVGVLGFAQESISFLPNISALKDENELLRKVNAHLADEVSQLREAKLENIRLRSMIALKETSTYKLTAAHIVAKNLNLLRNTITLNSGTAQGIQIGNPIVTGEGLVGRVVATSENYSIAQIILNVDFRASAKVQRSRVDGIIAWDGHTLLLKDVVKSMDVKVGDAVITSEYSNAFPPGYKIGIVSAVEDIPNSLFKRVELISAVNLTSTEEVFALNYVPSLERMALELQSKK